MVYARPFEWFVLACILASTLMLCLETPTRPETDPFNDVLYAADIAFTSVFAAEMIMKVRTINTTSCRMYALNYLVLRSRQQSNRPTTTYPMHSNTGYRYR